MGIRVLGDLKVWGRGEGGLVSGNRSPRMSGSNSQRSGTHRNGTEAVCSIPQHFEGGFPMRDSPGEANPEKRWGVNTPRHPDKPTPTDLARAVSSEYRALWSRDVLPHASLA
jgi:hypothetical protein